MRSVLVLLGSLVVAAPVGAADPPARKPLGPADRAGVLALIAAVDRAQQTDAGADEGVTWENHVLKAGDQTAYVAFRLGFVPPSEAFTSALMYVRAVSRHDGLRAADERSVMRDALLRGTNIAVRTPE